MAKADRRIKDEGIDLESVAAIGEMVATMSGVPDLPVVDQPDLSDTTRIPGPVNLLTGSAPNRPSQSRSTTDHIDFLERPASSPRVSAPNPPHSTDEAPLYALMQQVRALTEQVMELKKQKAEPFDIMALKRIIVAALKEHRPIADITTSSVDEETIRNIVSEVVKEQFNHLGRSLTIDAEVIFEKCLRDVVQSGNLPVSTTEHPVPATSPMPQVPQVSPMPQVPAKRKRTRFGPLFLAVAVFCAVILGVAIGKM